MDKDY